MLLQYVDDLLCGPSEKIISEGIGSLLYFLATRVYKISQEKAQLCLSQITYRAMILEGEIGKLGPERIQPIFSYPLPQSVKQLKAFLGTTGYCTIWIFGYAEKARSLYECLKEAQGHSQAVINWTSEARKAFNTLKTALTQALF